MGKLKLQYKKDRIQHPWTGTTGLKISTPCGIFVIIEKKDQHGNKNTKGLLSHRNLEKEEFHLVRNSNNDIAVQIRYSGKCHIKSIVFNLNENLYFYNFITTVHSVPVECTKILLEIPLNEMESPRLSQADSSDNNTKPGKDNILAEERGFKPSFQNSTNEIEANESVLPRASNQNIDKQKRDRQNEEDLIALESLPKRKKQKVGNTQNDMAPDEILKKTALSPPINEENLYAPRLQLYNDVTATSSTRIFVNAQNDSFSTGLVPPILDNPGTPLIGVQVEYKSEPIPIMNHNMQGISENKKDKSEPMPPVNNSDNMANNNTQVANPTKQHMSNYLKGRFFYCTHPFDILQ